MSESLAALLRLRAAEAPEALAVLAPGRPPLTYARLLEQVESTGAQLASQGISRGDRVALVLPNGPEAAAAFLSVAAFAPCAPLNPAYRHAELDFAFADIGVQAVVVAAGVDTPARELAVRRGDMLALELAYDEAEPAGTFDLGVPGRRPAAPTEEGDVALLLHTSGTTSRPKLVPLTHRNLRHSARNVAATLGLTGDDRCLNVMPLFHVHGLVGALLASLSAGGSVVCVPRFHSPSFPGWLSEHRPTWYTAVPTIHQSVLARIREDPAALEGSALRLVRSSSAPLASPVHSALEQVFGVPVVEAYGMTEASHQMTSNPLPPRERRPGSVGLPAGAEVAILDPGGRPLPAGEVGEVAVRGDGVFAGYEHDDAANAAAFTDGWFRTGDEGVLDEDGYLFLRGRLKEIVNRGGEKIAPAEVDSVLLAHPAVAEAVTFAVPDDRLGEDVAAAVVLREGSQATERELREFAAGSLADFKVPALIELVDEIPRGPTGKLQRLGLAERLGLAGSRTPKPAGPARPPTPLERELAGLWAATLDRPEVGVEDDFFALGGDSILAAELLARIEERFGGEIPLTTLMWAPTVAGFAAVLEKGGWDGDSPLVAVQPRGSSPPLFVTHTLGNEVLNVSVLRDSLGEGQPLYAVRARLDSFDFGSVEELAGHYLDEVQEVQPSGPYFFASLCSGGPIVIEMARHALGRGEAVGLVAVIDPRASGRPGPSYYARRFVTHARAGTLRRAVSAAARRKARRAPPAPASAPGPADEYVRAASAIKERYRLRPAPVTLAVFSTMDYDVSREFWEQFARRVVWRDVPAPHLTIFHHPHAELLGAALGEVLREAQEEAGVR